MAPVRGVVCVLLPLLVQGTSSGASMNCGPDVGLCGLLVLESGYGSGTYNHPDPEVHGLWPETGSYGTSECIAPGSTADPTVVYSCYNQAGETQESLLSFEQHEWEAHGVCAGADNAADFFTQVFPRSPPSGTNQGG
jgi:hypothetical protein